MQIKYKNEWSQKIFNSHNEDPESKLGTYLTINPTLIKPDRNMNLMEHERIILTRFRTGSHNLRIETEGGPMKRETNVIVIVTSGNFGWSGWVKEIL